MGDEHWLDTVGLNMEPMFCRSEEGINIAQHQSSINISDPRTISDAEIFLEDKGICLQHVNKNGRPSLINIKADEFDYSEIAMEIFDPKSATSGDDNKINTDREKDGSFGVPLTYQKMIQPKEEPHNEVLDSSEFNAELKDDDIKEIKTDTFQSASLQIKDEDAQEIQGEYVHGLSRTEERFQPKEEIGYVTYQDEAEKLSLRTTVELLDLQMPYHATVNSITGQIDQHTFICLTCGAKLSAILEFQEHQEIHSKPAILEGVDERNATAVVKSMKKCLQKNKRPQIMSTDRKPYLCQFCEKVFSSKGNLVRHERAHIGWCTGENPFKCQFCNQGFKLKAVMKNHEKIHAGEPFKCQFCGQGFGRRRDMKYHEKIHTGEKPFKCQFCSRAFRAKTAMNDHERIHRAEKPFVCPICDRKFRTKGAMVTHGRMHTKVGFNTCIKTYQCQFCDKLFKRLSSCKAHERCHTGEKPFKCRFCSRGFRDKTAMNYHERIHADEKPKPFQCQFCAQKFSTKWYLEVHERTHTDEKPFICQFCAMQFIRKQSLVQHEAIHMGLKQCDVCSKLFMSHRLKRHQRTHIDEKPFICKLCNKVFKYRASLIRHQVTHTGEKPFNCPFCKRQFNLKENLRVHERTHIGEKPFVCQFCSKRFNRKVNLNTHERIHTGEKPYVCKFCQKAFNDQGNAIKHERSHSTETSL